MNKYNFFRRFLPFLDEMFHAMMPMFQYEWAVPLVTSLLSGWGGTQTPAPTTQTQTMQYLPPQYTPQQQAINNLMYYGIMQHLMQPESPYADIINQMLYGTPAAGTQAAAPGTAEGIIAEYERQKAAAAETEKQLGETREELTIRTLQPIWDLSEKLSELSPEERRSNKEMIESGKNAIAQLQDLTGRSKDEALRLVVAAANSTIPYSERMISRGVSESDLRKHGEALGVFTREDFGEKTSLENLRLDIAGMYYDQEYQKRAMLWQPEGELPEYAREEEVPAAGEEVPVTDEEAPAPTGGLLGQMPTAEQIAKEFGLIRERGMEDISKWYQQAQRELEQRGISQYGGYMGTPFERDIGGILGKRGELEATLGSELGIAQSAAQTQNWYDMLQALGNLQALQSNIYSQQMTPWLGAAQQMTNVPYPYTTTTTTPGQPAGFLPAFVGGLYGGAGLMESISNWGRGGTAATSTIPSGRYTYLNYPGRA